MTTDEMLRAIDEIAALPRDFYEREPKGEKFSEREVEAARRIARVLDDSEGWFVSPANGGGILFECDDLMIEVTSE